MQLNEYLIERTGIEFLEAKIISKLYFNEYYEEIMDLDLVIIKSWLEKEIQKIQKELEERECNYEEEGSDKDFDRYAVEVMNNDGYYNSEGKFIRYKNPE